MSSFDVTLEGVKFLHSVVQDVSLLIKPFHVLVRKDELLLRVHQVLLLDCNIYFLAFLDVVV